MTELPVTADTSVVIAAVSRWHEAHTAALEATADVEWLPAHVVLEAVSALTRMPRGLAVPASRVLAALTSRFPGRPVALTTSGYRDLLRTVEHAGMRGGQVYDALVAATAVQAGAALLSQDRRALPAYRAVGVSVTFLD